MASPSIDAPDTQDGGEDKSWRSLWLSSGALSIALLGDSLIYIVLPVNADAFGIGLAWVGVLLAANRIIRIFTYGLVARLGEWIGMRNLCLFACMTAILSTAAYGLFQGWEPLLGARAIWGLSYAALLLVTLGYAATDRAKTGTRVGMSRAVEQVGPLVSLTGGAWLAGIVGPQEVFLLFALASCASLPLAFLLPPRVTRIPSPKSGRPSAFPKPDRLDLLIFWMGVGVDGVFTMTVTIMLAKYVSIEMAMLSAGAIISVRRVAEIAVAPSSGMIADRFGVRRPLVAAALLLVAGFAMVGAGWLFAGASAVVVARGALGTLFPAAVALFAPAGLLQPLARNQTWRDIGAAVGPLGTGFALAIATPEALHLWLAAIFAAFLAWLIMSPWWRGGGQRCGPQKT